MSTPAPTPAPTPSSTPSSHQPTKATEIKLISHSSLFYWWPVWVMSFFLAAWTFLEGNRLAIVPPHGSVVANASGGYDLAFKKPSGEERTTSQMIKAEAITKAGLGEPFVPRVSQHTWPGTVFCFTLLLTVVITNVPLRGLWSAIVVVIILLLVILFAMLGWWERIFSEIESLQIHINLAGYLFIGTGTLIVWAMATFMFDRRSYVVFTPGQIRVCEHIGASVQTFGTMGVSLEKQRDDVFRHYIFGFGSGDLILRVGSGDKQVIRLPNVLGIGSRLRTVEDLLRTMSTT